MRAKKQYKKHLKESSKIGLGLIEHKTQNNNIRNKLF